ncbi:MAG: helix-turn-helix transcriptional regulator [Symploca sp. SIO2E6]|nr:helix-turn-helix transcriptional regulator [Symploca sp. SIO2E6]
MHLKPKSRIAALRKKAGYTQAQLGVFIGVTTNTIQNWEKDNGLDQLEKYLKLCTVLGCDLKELIEYVEAPEEEAKPKGFSLEELRELRERWGTNGKLKKPNPKSVI